MRQLLAFAMLMVPVSVLMAQDAADPLAPGKNLPSTFHAFNVNEAVAPVIETEEPKTKSREVPYSTRNKYHCLISRYDLDPTVMLLVRGSTANDSLRDLLKNLDQIIEDNRRFVRLRAFVVFLPDEVNNLIEDDDRRDAIARQLETLATDLKLRNVVVALAARSDLAKYRLGDTALTAVLYKKLKIAASHRFAADKIDQEAEATILADVKSKLGAKR